MMQTHAIVAEQTSRNRYRRPAPLPPREIELTVRLEIPEETGVDIGINPSFTPPLPPQWDDVLQQRLFLGVHGGLASVGEPLPVGGIGVSITRLRVFPPLGTDSDIDDIRRLGDVLEALTAATVAALWAGAMSLGATSAPVSRHSRVPDIPRHKAEMREQRAAEVDAQHEAAAAKQAERGKRGARQRVLDLLDEGSFQELDPFVQGRSTTFGMERSRPYGDGVVTGFGTIDGRRVAIFSQDFTVYGGSLGEAFAEKLVKLMDLAARYGVPVIGINDSAGARIQEGVEGLAGYGEVFYRNVRLSGVVPQISAIAGPVCRRRRLLAGDDRLRGDGRGLGQMFITGPDVIRTVTGEEVSHEELGGAAAHMERERRGPSRRRRRGRPQRPDPLPPLVPAVQQSGGPALVRAG